MSFHYHPQEVICYLATMRIGEVGAAGLRPYLLTQALGKMRRFIGFLYAEVPAMSRGCGLL